MAGNMESMLLGGSDSSSDDSDNEELEEVTTGTAASSSSAVAATVMKTSPSPVAAAQPPTIQSPAAQPPTGAPSPSNMSRSELSSRLKSLYSPAAKVAAGPAPAPPQQQQQQGQAQQQAPQQKKASPPTQTHMAMHVRASPIQQVQAQPQQKYTSAQQPPQTSTASSSSSMMRPLVPNRPRQTTPAPAAASTTSDPFEPTPLRTMLQREQAKGVQVIPPDGGATVSSASSVQSGGSQQNAAAAAAAPNAAAAAILSAEQRAKLELDAKHRKEKFLMFTRVLMKYLEQRDVEMHKRAKAVIKECAERNKNKEKGYESVTMSMRTRLRQTVGDNYWHKAEGYLTHFMKQKKKIEDANRDAKRQNQQQPGQQQSKAGSSSSKGVEQTHTQHTLAALEKKAAESKAANLARKRKEEEIRRKKLGDAQQLANFNRAQQAAALDKLKRENAAKMAQLKSIPGTSPPDGKKKPRSKPPTPTAGAAAPATAGLRLAPSTADAKAQPPREYGDLMEMVDHAVTYDWTSAGLICGSRAEINLDEEQRKLLYGTSVRPKAPKPPAEGELPAALRGWGKRNVLSPRIAWAKIRLREQRRELTQAQAGQVPVVAGLKLPTATETSPAPSPTTTPLTTWINEDKAEEDKTLAVLSEATEIYLKSILEKAVIAARQRQNLDGIRLWHQQHGPHKPPLSLRLGCDVRRQVAQAAGNAARTCQRMEQALERQTDVPAKARDLEDEETLFQASSMADLSLRPKLARASAAADLNAKRSFEVYGGKDSSSVPLGRVPKRPKILLRDFALGMDLAGFAHQRTGFTRSNLM